jgi:predicted ester cyclase
MQFTTGQNKQIVIRFNKEYIEQGNSKSFEELVAKDVVNHSAPPGTSKGADGMIHFLQNVLRTGFPDLTVEILDQVAEGDLVTTRKAIHATHSGDFMGMQATGKKVIINVIDIIRLRQGKYVEHWGMSNIPDVMAQLSFS